MSILILGLETSCDECSAAVVTRSGADSQKVKVLSEWTHSQIKTHQPYGGVVPEIASRNHLETVNQAISETLKAARVEPNQLDAIAVTQRPGLVGALLVGVSAAKAFAYATHKPVVPVHHLEGHVSSLFINQTPDLESYPLLVAVISGGHTNLYVLSGPPKTWAIDVLDRSLVGRSRDDAAGEAFDKTAKLLGFPYPGGVWIDRKSEGGDPKKFSLPRALPQKKVLDLSFSGLKTAAAQLISRLEKEGKLEDCLADVCASVQEAIVDAIFSKIQLAIEKHHCRGLGIVGGVAANSRLRERLGKEIRVPVYFPELKYCTDNGAMIAAAGSFRFEQGHYVQDESLLTLNAFASQPK